MANDNENLNNEAQSSSNNSISTDSSVYDTSNNTQDTSIKTTDSSTNDSSTTVDSSTGISDSSTAIDSSTNTVSDSSTLDSSTNSTIKALTESLKDMLDKLTVPYDQMEVYPDAEETSNGYVFKNEDTASILMSFQSWSDTNDAISNSISNGVPSPATSSTKSGEENKQTIIKNAVKLTEMGKALKQGCQCAVCGKQVPWMPQFGYCSFECAWEDFKNRLEFRKYKDNPFQKYIDGIRNVLTYIDLAMNLIMELPNKLKQIAKLPPEYANYLKMQINKIFLKIKIVINKLLIYKNKLLLLILDPMKWGVIGDKLGNWLEKIQPILETYNKIKTNVDLAVKAILNMMENPIYTLPAGSFVWAQTLRGIINNPQYQFYVEVPVPCPSPLGTALDCLDVNLIHKIVTTSFPSIKPIEYFYEPEVFDVRLALSDQSQAMRDILDFLELTCKVNVEYLPRYKDLNLKNPWYILAMLMSWGPKGRQQFGSFINPYV